MIEMKDVISFLEEAIKTTDGKDEYYVGVRNGLRVVMGYIMQDENVVLEAFVPVSTTQTQKSLGNTDVNGTSKNVSDLVVFGNGDMFKLLCKASSQNEGWMKSTKACQVSCGCIVQVTTQQRNPDGSYAVAEALTFVPGVVVQEDTNKEGEVIGRRLL